jgi:hypothetical protein
LIFVAIVSSINDELTVVVLTVASHSALNYVDIELFENQVFFVAKVNRAKPNGRFSAQTTRYCIRAHIFNSSAAFDKILLNAQGLNREILDVTKSSLPFRRRAERDRFFQFISQHGTPRINDCHSFFSVF